MNLLSGADLTIRFDWDKKLYIANVHVGGTHKQAMAKDPVQALGLAVMLQAGFTENSLKAELDRQAHQDEKDQWPLGDFLK